MKEEFLHYLWKYSLYDPESLLDNDKNKIRVIHPGEYNKDSGPDFFNARIQIGDTSWAGNVEIHTSSSHFDNHGHNHDPAFDNVILHVVANNDRRVFNSKGEEVLTTTISFNPDLYDKYLELVNNPCLIACQEQIRDIDKLFIRHWLGSVLIDRLQDKMDQIMRIYTETGHDWEETFYRLLVRYFGFRVNTGPFEMLAVSLPFRIIRKHSDNRFQVEALLFGTAGLLDEGLFRNAIIDDYYISLIREYKILSSKYSLQPLHGFIWKFARLRPANFPTVRISQLAAMLCGSGGLFSRALECNNIRQLKGVFEVEASEYWNDHFIFGKKSRFSPKHTGSQASDLLLINAVTPAIFVYGKTRDLKEVSERALSFLEDIPPEANSITDEWKLIGIEAESAFYSQALIRLRNEYCKKRRCLDCRIGARLISMGRCFRKHEELMLEP
ncbi:MAG TPA: DUF2851 family protein [Bacteroidales bacterium]|jgi:hypothetical protein|nr:DUF2851 family protein [Bacteroidales bacterium]HOX74062.1 DUF2851 family protein [Bacteroidales bacterium]HPM86712.1 DUF2851 family protein [Bacteroidales bacterium]HQM69301.1 DUF2851 family protein [Bacteroidales bacterium]